MSADNFVSLLEAAALEPVSIVHQYRLESANDREGVFAFFEGDEDKMFYLVHVRRYAEGRQIYPHICDGKQGVIDVYKELMKENGALLFFVDRDYDDWIGVGNAFGEKVFVTKWYSAENYFASIDTVGVVWDEFIPLPRDKRLDAFVGDFLRARSEFSQSLLSITAWMLAHRERGDKVILSNIQIKSLVEVGGNLRFMRKKGALVELKRCTILNGGALGAPRVAHWAKVLCNLDPLLWVRGKFLLWFVSEYLSKRLEDIRKSMPKGSRKTAVPVGISQKKLFEVLGGRIPCPEELQEYLRRNIVLS